MKLDGNAHSVFLLYYHLVLVVKYRRRIFDDTISNRAKEIFEYIAPNYNITLQEWNHDKDHVQILFKAHPNSEISKFINAYKSASSRLLKKEFPPIRQKLWKEYFWSQSFCLLTTGGAPVDVIRKYIESQGEKHWIKPTNSEYIGKSWTIRLHSTSRNTGGWRKLTALRWLTHKGTCKGHIIIFSRIQKQVFQNSSPKNAVAEVTQQTA